MKITREFAPADRYAYDWALCGNGFAQVDTSQDAPYYGTWCSPEHLLQVNYCEGDVTLILYDDPQEFHDGIRELKRWTEEHGWAFHGIDPGFSKSLEAWFEAVGLADMLH